MIKAAGKGDIDALREYLKEEDNRKEWSRALVEAAEKEKWECVKILIKAGADVNSESCWNALNYASMYNNLECVDLLIKAGADVNHFKRTTCLNLTKDVKVAELLINAGADVNRVTYEDEYTPLVNAAERGKADLVKLLIDSGADVNHLCVYGTALERAVYGHHSDCVRVLAPLVKEKDKQVSFLLAAHCGNIESIKVFLELGQDVNAKIVVHDQCRKNEVTALMRAAHGNEIECIEYLIQHGANVDELDDYGNNVLVFASISCRVEAMEYLIKQPGITVNACNKENETALMKIIDQPYVVYNFVGKSMGEQNDTHSECVQLMVESGADLNRRNASGDTALNLAAKQNQLEYIKILLSAGARINRFNKAGHNAYMTHVEESKRQCEDLKLMLFSAGESQKQFKIDNTTVEGEASALEDRFESIDMKDEGTYKTDLDIDWGCWVMAEDCSDEMNSLKENCRETIRRQLLSVNAFKNLFQRIPFLGLPSSLQSYLLYDVTLNLE